MPPQLLSGTGRAGKGDNVLAIEMVEQIARAAADQADCPSGTSPLSTIILTIACVSCAVAVAGLMMAGIPASQVGASFSSIPSRGS